jgi:hypothetical protein
VTILLLTAVITQIPSANLVGAWETRPTTLPFDTTRAKFTLLFSGMNRRNDYGSENHNLNQRQSSALSRDIVDRGFRFGKQNNFVNDSFGSVAYPQNQQYYPYQNENGITWDDADRRQQELRFEQIELESRLNEIRQEQTHWMQQQSQTERGSQYFPSRLPPPAPVDIHNKNLEKILHQNKLWKQQRLQYDPDCFRKLGSGHAPTYLWIGT